MAKKIVRGITDVKTINNQDYDTNNVNDLLSDGQYNYIHRKKGKTEEYHNLTDNIKTISSDNTDLLAVTNNNKTTNTATLHPKHDAQKEQVLESTRNTVTIHHGTNGTDEKTTVDTNPEKVLEHENLSVTDGLTKEHTGNTTTIKVNPKEVLFHQNLTGEQGIEVLHLPNLYGSNVKLSDDFVATVNGKQNKLTAMEGLTITADNISLNIISFYDGDLNELTYTCMAKPANEATNLPTGVAGHGILKVERISDVVSQQYHMYADNSIYIRSCRGANESPEWTPWVKVNTTPLS